MSQSPVQNYYRAHARQFSSGRMSPLGLSAGGIGSMAGGLAMTSLAPAGAQDALMAVAVMGWLVGMVDVGIALLVGPRPSGGRPVARQLGQTQTLTADRQFLVSSIVGGLGLGVLGYGLTSSGRAPGPPALVAAFIAVVALWGGVLIAKSRTLTVTINDSGIEDNTFPLRHRFASWERIASAHILATTPVSAQVVLELRDAPAPTGAAGAATSGGSRLRIPCGYLTLSADELLATITADPNFGATTAPSVGNR
ncbi:hypothetical protein [Terrabacter sp. NPDC080008]|uniref:hypothetical protein n=1 Tax=Terrabacter sp. NPDC080008 TaxID=3155176 RepID=UPI00344C349B